MMIILLFFVKIKLMEYQNIKMSKLMPVCYSVVNELFIYIFLLLK